MNAIGALLLAAALLGIMVLPPRWSLAAMLLGCLYIPETQQLQVAGFNIFPPRFIELAGFCRWGAYKLIRPSRWGRVDRAFVIFFVFTTVIFLIRSREDIPYRIGAAVDAFLCYFTFRRLVADLEDLRFVLRVLAIALIPYVILLFIESRTRSNPFAAMGVVDLWDYTRNGRLRCFGSFQHPSLLGTFAATLFPLYISLAFNRADRGRAILGLAMCMGIIYTCNSGAPIGCIGLCIVGWFCWKIRTKMHLLRRGIVVLLLLASVGMKASIWYLPAKLSIITGGDGYHRSYLMEAAFHDISHWGLAGMSLSRTIDWFPTHLDNGLSDITNQYIYYGLQAGLISLSLFIWIFVRGFSTLGQAMAICRVESPSPAAPEYMLWGLGVMLAEHAMNLMGISYYDQSYVYWYFDLATIASLAQLYLDGGVPASSIVGQANHGSEGYASISV